ncbi:hypothetical protein D3C75_949270 [compost metagenome]
MGERVSTLFSMSCTMDSYRAPCSAVSGTKVFISFLSGRSNWMAGSFFTRRSRKGLINCCTWPMRAVLPFSTSLTKFLLNSPNEPRYPGFTTSKIDHSSVSRFSIGVPVSAIRWRAFSLRTAAACLVYAFLIFCASSRQRALHSTRARDSSSIWVRVYEVRTTSAPSTEAGKASPLTRWAP